MDSLNLHLTPLRAGCGLRRSAMERCRAARARVGCVRMQRLQQTPDGKTVQMHGPLVSGDPEAALAFRSRYRADYDKKPNHKKYLIYLSCCFWKFNLLILKH